VTQFDRLKQEHSVHNGSFRVENRRARPKIVQNVLDLGNAFFSKQASILNSSQKHHRRGVSSPGTEALFLIKNDQTSTMAHSEHKPLVQTIAGTPEVVRPDKDQFNFTFFKEQVESRDPFLSLQSDSHINVSSLLNSAHAYKRSEALALSTLKTNEPTQGSAQSHNWRSTLVNNANISSKEYASYLHQQFQSAESNEREEDLKTPGVKQSHGYPMFNNVQAHHTRSNSTGLKPKTAVRLQSLPWNLQPINFEVATTATSHSRRTTEHTAVH